MQVSKTTNTLTHFWNLFACIVTIFMKQIFITDKTQNLMYNRYFHCQDYLDHVFARVYYLMYTLL